WATIGVDPSNGVVVFENHQGVLRSVDELKRVRMEIDTGCARRSARRQHRIISRIECVYTCVGILRFLIYRLRPWGEFGLFLCKSSSSERTDFRRIAEHPDSRKVTLRRGPGRHNRSLLRVESVGQ